MFSEDDDDDVVVLVEEEEERRKQNSAREALFMYTVKLRVANHPSLPLFLKHQPSLSLGPLHC